MGQRKVPSASRPPTCPSAAPCMRGVALSKDIDMAHLFTSENVKDEDMEKLTTTFVTLRAQPELTSDAVYPRVMTDQKQQKLSDWFSRFKVARGEKGAADQGGLGDGGDCCGRQSDQRSAREGGQC
eukprot:3571514-Rhodomonas_salina.1